MMKPRFPVLALWPSLVCIILAGYVAAPGTEPPGTDDKPPYEPAPPFKAFLKTLQETGNPLDRMTAESVPTLWWDSELKARQVLEPPPRVRLTHLCVPARNHQIPLRIYTPWHKEPPREGRLPILVFFHGGGWTLGSVAQYDNLTRALTSKIPAMVISVDYRLAPEHPFPAGLDDAYLALEWVARNAEAIGGNKDLIAVAGDSGGGTLATVTARKARLAGIPVIFQALLYPSTDIGHTDYLSYRQYGKGYYLTRKAVESFRQFYVPNKGDWDRADVSPLRAPDRELAQLPPTLIVVAGCDPLRDEGLAYARKLRDNKVPVTCSVKKEAIHGFLNFYNRPVTGNPKVDRAASALAEPVLEEAARKIRSAFTRRKP